MIIALLENKNKSKKSQGETSSFMQMAELFEKAISGSEFAGDFEYGKLLRHVFEHKYNGIATGENNRKSILLVFVSGQAEGAAQIDDYGMLYGDKVIYSLDKSGSYKLYLIEKKIAEGLAARTRIFDKKNLKQDNFSKNLYDIKNFSTKPSKVKIIVLKDEKPACGLKIIMKKNNVAISHDYTSSDGNAGFFLQGGDYHCIIIEKDSKEHIFQVKLSGKESLITIKI
ncbi:MAG: hypothetical protein JXQ82_03775 [Methanomicrobiaceae archaeon]|nr:hypothetical protein [Methanomicrobiaceae archaeon]